jgi:hypothetical protein
LICTQGQNRSGTGSAPALDRRGPAGSDISPVGRRFAMHSIFYIIGVIVVVLAILSLLGVT